MTWIRVDFIGEIHELEPGDELTFGRAGDLVVDENPQLHRIAGRIVHVDGVWWLVNEGGTIPLLLADVDTRSSATLAPGRRTVISFAESAIRFRAGTTDYEILTELLGDVPAPPPVQDDHDGDVNETTSFAEVPLTEEQRLLLVALSEPLLRDPHLPLSIEANRAIANRLDWSITKLNRKLDNLCAKYTRAGVSGLRGSADSLASDRRRMLVEHVVEMGIVTEDDLGLLPSS